MQTIDPKPIQQLAEKGDVKAQLELGKLRLAQERYDDAASWLRKAAEQQEIEAQCLLGSLLAEGLGVDQDFEAAAFWLRQAAESGHSGAQVLLAQTFESGNGVPVNHALAASWFLKAAEQADPIAQFRIGQLLRHGQGVERNVDAAIRWLRTGAEAGCQDALCELIECLLEAPGANYGEIFELAKHAGANGSARGQFLFAHVIENAPDAAGDMAEAEKWYRLAGEQGFADAQMRLAKLYAEGRIVTANPAEAERWLNLAVAHDGKTTRVPASGAAAQNSAEGGIASGVIALSEYPPGSIIDKKYFIMSLLGKGGMCRVYKAKHLTMNRMVALKMMLPELSANVKLVQRFQREAQSASTINHPNVINIYDLGTTDDGKPFMVMDFLEGHSLEERIDSLVPIPIAEFVDLFRQACAGLGAAHEAGIIHRDVKPSNIMVVKDKHNKDVVKVVDFGLVKMLEAGEDDHKLTKTGEIFGTLMFMSPEQCLGHPLDARTDIYSLGCTMYEALTFVPVHTGESAFELMSKHINTKPQAISLVAPHIQCPPALEKVIFKALAKNREERYQTMSEMDADLAAVLGAGS